MSKKRGQGEGSIYKRKDGLWSAQITVQGKRLSRYFKTQRDGLDWLQSMRNQVQAGLTATGAQLQLADFLDQWLGSIRASVRPKTLHQYSQIARKHVNPTLGKLKLKDLRPDQIQHLYNQKLDTGNSARTVILIHAVLHKALKQAVKWGSIGHNPADAVTRPKFRRKEMNILTDSQARAFLSGAEQTRFDALFYLAVHTGMRQGELLGLKWTDLNWSSREIHVNRQLQQLYGQGLIFNEPKTSSGRRAVVISEKAINKLRLHLEKQQAERISKDDAWNESNLIFPNKNGKAMNASNMVKEFKSLLSRLGLPEIRFHDLRHTAATLMLQQGIHPKIVQERLGHADINMTLNTYSHVLPSMQKEAADILDELLTPINVTDEIKEVKELTRDYTAK